MLEQATASYLKNCEGCLITQTNWSISDNIFKQSQKIFTNRLDNIKHELELEFTQDEINSIFKKSTNDQFITQCEIDVVGLKFDNDHELQMNNTIFLYDTAFHEQGLHYKDSKSTVLKKIIRAFVIGDVLFKDFDIRIGFISPTCDKTTAVIINNCIAKIACILQKHNPKISIDLYLNNQCDDMIQELVSSVDDIADTNDLFIRSNLSNANQAQSLNNNTNACPNSACSNANKTPRGANKAIVENIVQDLININKLAVNTQLLIDLQDQKYTKANFDISSFPFLIENVKITKDQQNRFYPKTYLIGGKVYRVCSQWIPDRIKKLQNWYKTI